MKNYKNTFFVSATNGFLVKLSKELERVAGYKINGIDSKFCFLFIVNTETILGGVKYEECTCNFITGSTYNEYYIESLKSKEKPISLISFSSKDFKYDYYNGIKTILHMATETIETGMYNNRFRYSFCVIVQSEKEHRELLGMSISAGWKINFSSVENKCGIFIFCGNDRMSENLSHENDMQPNSVDFDTNSWRAIHYKIPSFNYCDIGKNLSINNYLFSKISSQFK